MYPTRITVTLLHEGLEVIANEGPDLIINAGATQLGIEFGERAAETAVIADILIEKLQEIRKVALRQAVALGQTEEIGAGTFVRADITAIADRFPAAARFAGIYGGGVFIAPELHTGPCPWGFEDAGECATYRERSVAGKSDNIPACSVHGPFMDHRDLRVDDRPGFPTCTIEGHVLGCPGAAGGEHQLVAVADGDHFAGRPD